MPAVGRIEKLGQAVVADKSIGGNLRRDFFTRFAFANDEMFFALRLDVGDIETGNRSEWRNVGAYAPEKTGEFFKVAFDLDDNAATVVQNISGNLPMGCHVVNKGPKTDPLDDTFYFNPLAQKH